MGDPHHVIVVGGGAGGLELVTRLGDRFGRTGRAAVTLVDKNETHLWKPLLHEVAAGSMDIHAHQLDYLAQARWHHFNFCVGAFEGLNRARRELVVAPTFDERGAEVIPRRTLRYDTLVIAVGSVANTFGVPGVAEHAYALESAAEADRFHRRLINACMQANYRPGEAQAQLRIVIVGGGATGVELAAELHNTTRVLAAYGLAPAMRCASNSRSCAIATSRTAPWSSSTTPRATCSRGSAPAASCRARRRSTRSSRRARPARR
jgi:NADH dehydrogenase